MREGWPWQLRLLQWWRRLVCRVFGHNMYHGGVDVADPYDDEINIGFAIAFCRRCGGP